MLQTTEVMIRNQGPVPGLHLRIEKERMMKLRINEVDPKNLSQRNRLIASR